MQQENGNGEVSSAAGLKRKGTPLTEEERRIRRKEINRESARRIRKRKNNEMESLKQQVRRPAAGATAYPPRNWNCQLEHTAVIWTALSGKSLGDCGIQLEQLKQYLVLVIERAPSQHLRVHISGLLLPCQAAPTIARMSGSSDAGRTLDRWACGAACRASRLIWQAGIQAEWVRRGVLVQVGQLTNQVQLLIRFAAHVTRENRELALRLQQAAAQGGRHAQEEMQDPGLVASEALPAYEAQLTAQQYAPVHLPGLPQQ